jgi:hypothetical protein
MKHVEDFNGVGPTTLRNYRVVVGKLEDEFSEALLLRKLTVERLKAYQARLLSLRRVRAARAQDGPQPDARPVRDPRARARARLDLDQPR